MSSAGSDAKISGSKIDPLESGQKTGVPHAESTGGTAGADHTIDQARLNPVGGHGQGQHPEPHADDEGVVGRESTLAGAKIDPLVGQAQAAAQPASGLSDESVDAARIQPMGEVRKGD